jgi:hypothetical protein
MHALDWRSLPLHAPGAKGGVVALSAASSAASSAAAYASAGHDGLTDVGWDAPWAEHEAPPKDQTPRPVPPCPPQTPAPALEHKAEAGGAAKKPDGEPLSIEETLKASATLAARR